jgi:sialic acid synthase SpsE
MEGPDHPFAMEPHELSEMVYLIRQAEIATSGYRNSNFTESERDFKKAMRSVVAKKSIKAGETLSEDNITTKRPFLEDAIPASSFYELIGKIANEDIEEDELLTTSKVKL